MACWSSTGMSFKTKQHGSSPRAEIPCLETRFQHTDDLEAGRTLGATCYLRREPPGKCRKCRSSIAAFHYAGKAWQRNQRGIRRISNEEVKDYTSYFTAAAKHKRKQYESDL